MNLQLAFREQLENWTREELDQLIASIVASWNVEHTDTDGHADITGYSLTLTKDTTTGKTGEVVAGGSGSFSGGQITLDMTESGNRVQIGDLSVIDNLHASGIYPGIRFTNGLFYPDGSKDYAILLGSGHGVMSGLTQTLQVWTPGYGFASLPVLELGYSTVNGGFVLQPGAGQGLTLGQLGGGYGLTDIFTADIHASNGVHEHGRDAAMGEFVSRAYSSSDFTSSAGSWTVESGDLLQLGDAFVAGDMLFMSWHIGTSSVSGSPTSLQINLPSGYQVAGPSGSRASSIGTSVINGGGVTWEVGFVQALGGSTFVRLFRPGVVAFPTATNSFTAEGSILVPVVTV